MYLHRIYRPPAPYTASPIFFEHFLHVPRARLCCSDGHCCACAWVSFAVLLQKVVDFVCLVSNRRGGGGSFCVPAQCPHTHRHLVMAPRPLTPHTQKPVINLESVSKTIIYYCVSLTTWVRQELSFFSIQILVV